MMPVMCSRQIRNRQLADMRIAPHASYQPWPTPGDRVWVQTIDEQTLLEERFECIVEDVQEAGIDVKVMYLRDDDTRGELILCRTGWPPDWGCIGFKIVEQADLVETNREPLFNEDDTMVPIHDAIRCPLCGVLHDRIPWNGWPCLACRVSPDAVIGS